MVFVMCALSLRNGAAIAALFVVVPLAAAVAACPDLSGTFQCPALDGMPASTLVVTNKVSGGAMQYAFTYKIGGKDMSLRADASDAGIKKPDGQVTSCTATSYVHKGPNERGEGTRSFINAAGNFEVVSGGKTQRICVRKP